MSSPLRCPYRTPGPAVQEARALFSVDPLARSGGTAAVGFSGPAAVGARPAKPDASRSTCSSVWAADRVTRSLDVPPGTVGGRRAGTPGPWDCNALDAATGAD